MATLLTFIFYVPISNLQTHTRTHIHTSPSNVSHILNVTPNYTQAHTKARTHTHTHAFTFMVKLVYSHILLHLHTHPFSSPVPTSILYISTDGKLSLAMYWEQIYTETHRLTYAYTSTCTHMHTLTEVGRAPLGAVL